MTLEEFKSKIKQAGDKAHLFLVNSVGSPSLIRSVSIRIDDDGVVSILLHNEHMPKRILTDKAKETKDAIGLLRDIYEEEPNLRHEGIGNFSGYYVHWDEITSALSKAGLDSYYESPMELIYELINERDELKAKLSNEPSEMNGG